MNAPRDVDGIVREWLESGPTMLSERAFDAALTEVHRTRQRRPVRLKSRLSAMSMSTRLAAVAVIGVLVVGVAVLLARPGPPVVGGPSPAPGLIAGPSSSVTPSAGPSPSVVPARAPSWTPTGRMVTPRAGFTATLLPDGKVLVAGGYNGSQGQPLASAELYDPATGVWTATSSMGTPRVGYTATLLPDGRVLVAGGAATPAISMDQPPSVASAELYDPATGTWTTTGTMTTPRSGQTATLLRDGKVLVEGGAGGGSVGLASAELYDPVTGTWFTTGSMTQSRSGQTATLLRDGRVLVAGGVGPMGATGAGDLSSAEVYDPGSGSWTATGNMAGTAGGFTTALLSNGKVLHVGVPCDLFDPASGSWGVTGDMLTPRGGEGVTLLADGKVLVEGGAGGGSVGIASAELYDPASGSWTATASPGWGSQSATATLLLDGTVLVAGGIGAGGLLASAELYDPGSPAPSSSVVGPRPASWAPTGSMVTPREGHTATLLPDGRVLVTGGLNRTSGNPNGTILASAELYDPSSGSWSATGSMSRARENHTATLLPDGEVLVVGGFTGTGGKTIGTTLASAELYDPATGTWSATGSMRTARESHRATLLPDGEVLVVGGFLVTSDSPSSSSGGPLESAELYDPRSGTWTATGKMVHGGGTATLLPNGEVLVAGGYSSTVGGGYAPLLATAELYDPSSGTWAAASPKRPIDWMPTMATLLPNGKVLMACGCDHAGRASELYDPTTGSWTATGTMVADHWRDTATWLPDGTVTATLLADGKVLVAGGGSPTLPAAELYDPVTGSWTATAKMVAVRVNQTATLLTDGKVLVAGGEGDPFHTLASAELYDPGSP